MAMRNFLALRPGIRISFDVRRFESVLESVEAGTADLGFVMGLGHDSGLDAEAFFTGEMVCVMAPDHPLAELDVVTPVDLREYALIALRRETRMGAIVRQAFVEAGEPLRPSVEVRYCNTACVLAESGVGVTIVDPLSPRFAGRCRLAVRVFRPACRVSACVVQSRKRPLSRAAEAFLREVRVIASQAAEQIN